MSPLPHLNPGIMKPGKTWGGFLKYDLRLAGHNPAQPLPKKRQRDGISSGRLNFHDFDFPFLGKEWQHE